MRVTLAPILEPLRRRAGLGRGLEAVAAEIRVLSPAELRVPRPAAVFRLCHLERIRAVQEETTEARETARIEGHPVDHAPTTAFLLRDAAFVHGWVHCGGARLAQTGRLPLRRPCLLEEEVAACALPSSYAGSRYFGHFVTDDLVRGLLAREFAPIRFSREDRDARWPHARFYADFCGPEGPEIASAHIREAWVFSDYGLNASRRHRLVQLRGRVRAGPRLRRGHGVLLRRGRSGTSRLLANEAEIEARLACEGFEILDPAELTAEEIARGCRDAAVVCGVEGSALVHGVMAMSEGGALLVLQHPWRFNNIWKDFTDALGLGYGFVVGEGTREAFRVDPGEILALLEPLARRG